MNSKRCALICIITLSILFSNIPISHSILWDLVIDVELVQSPLQEGDIPVVFGNVIDHAGKPIVSAEIKLRLGQNTITSITDSNGEFIVEFPEFNELPGNYVVNVIVTSIDDKVGLASTDFQVKGELLPSSHTEKLLSTEEAIIYLHASVEDFEKDPIGLMLYNYYQNLLTKLIEQKNIEVKLYQEQQLLEGKRDISDEITEQVIEEEEPGAGTFSGWRYDRFVDNLDHSVRDIIVNQLNYTLNAFTEAQQARDQVLANGGTLEEARQAYLQIVTIPRDLMNSLTVINEPSFSSENFTQHITVTNGNLTENSQNITEFNQNTTINNPDLSKNKFILNVNGTYIEVGETDSVIYLTINGTVIKLIVNSTENNNTNSTQN